jgi:hypothetical protein
MNLVSNMHKKLSFGLANESSLFLISKQQVAQKCPIILGIVDFFPLYLLLSLCLFFMHIK